MRVRVLLACLLLPLLAWAALPVVSSGSTPQQKAAAVQRQIERTRTRIGWKKGREHVLSSDIAGYSRRIDQLQGDIDGLQQRENGLQADLDAKRAELARIQQQLRDERARLARLRARLAQ